MLVKNYYFYFLPVLFFEKKISKKLDIEINDMLTYIDMVFLNYNIDLISRRFPIKHQHLLY